MSTTALKILALILMTIDHVGEFFPNIPLVIRWIGRLSAPIFIFCSAQAFSHTSNRKKYILRLYFAGGIMYLLDLGAFYCGTAIPGFAQGVFLTNNFFRTLFSLSVIYFLMDCYRRKDPHFKKYLWYYLAWQGGSFLLVRILVQIQPTAALSMIEEFLPTLLGTIFNLEGGWPFLVFGAVIYWTKDDKKRLARAYLIFCAVYFLLVFTQFVPHCLIQLVEIFRLPDLESFLHWLCWSSVGLSPDYNPDPTFFLFEDYQWMMVAALPIILSYNGEKGKGWKYLFYLYYPLHILALYFIGGFLS